MIGEKYIAVLDVLGFRALLETQSLEDIYARYAQLISPGFCQGSANAHWNENPYRAMSGIDHPYAEAFIFSDSFVLVSHSAEDCAFGDLLIACSNLLGAGVDSGLYLRGAISFGKCVINAIEGAFLGKPIAEAYDLANNTEWIGVCLHPTCNKDSLFQRMETGRMMSGDLEYFDVPVKEGASCDASPVALSAWINETRMSALKAQGQKVAPHHRAKYDNAVAFARHVLRRRGGANQQIHGTAYRRP